ncbi:antitoxin MazE [Desulfonatronum zhilinae]|nr:antitoxin MazE [Desulfonatronum zhilinae]
MLTTVQKWGNAQGLQLPRDVLADVGIQVGDQVSVAVQGGLIVIAPSRTKRGKYRLEDLVARIPKDSQPLEMDWGKAEGKEVW